MDFRMDFFVSFWIVRVLQLRRRRRRRIRRRRREGDDE
jgi:hypothetical protein